jgi:hypothetical protein
MELGSREAAGPEFDSDMQMQNQNAHRVQGKTCIGLGPRDPPSLISDGKGEHNRTTDAKNKNSPPHTKMFGIFSENEFPYRATPRCGAQHRGVTKPHTPPPAVGVGFG